MDSDQTTYEVVILLGEKYKFYRGLDSIGDDIRYIGEIAISDLALIAKHESECVAFNNLGFLKRKINTISTSIYLDSENDGLYVKIESETKDQKKTVLSNYTNLKLINVNNDLRMLVNPNDQYISRDLINTGNWEPYMDIIFNKYVNINMTVFDIGANIGSHTLTLSKKVGDNGKVYAFEPCKINHDILFHNCILNKCNNVIIYKVGCGDIHKKMYIDSIWNETTNIANYGCVILQDEAKDINNESIRILPIDSLNLKVDFMKIDAEYMENKVLLGAMNTIKKWKPVIIIEIHKDEIPIIKSIFDSLDYNLTYIDGFDYLAVPNS